MAFEGILVLICSVTTFSLGILVLSYDWKRSLYWATFLFAAVMAIQRISKFGIINAANEEQVLLYFRWRCIGYFNTGVGCIAFWYYARMEKRVSLPWQYLIFLIILLPGIFFSYRLMFTPAINNMLTLQPDAPYGFEIRRHLWVDHLSTIWFSFLLILDVILSWMAYHGDKVKQQRAWKFWIFIFILINSVWLIGYDLISINHPRSLFSLNSSLLLTAGFIVYAWAFSDFQLFTVKTEKAIEGIIDSMHNLLLLTDRQLTISEVNPAACQVLGLPPEEILGRSIADFLDQDQWSETVDQVLSLGQQSERLNHEFDLGTEEQRYHILMTISPIFSRRRRPIGYIFVGTDLTSIQQAQGKLEEYAEHLKRSNQDLEQFAHIASHDLKEPLRSITSFSMLLERRYGHALDKVAKEYFYFIISNAKQMRRLIDDILVYSQIEVQYREKEGIDLNEVPHSVQQNLNELLTSKEAQVEIVPLPKIKASWSHMLRLFQNLVENAVKYNDKQPPVIQIQYHREGKEHRFRIRDNGIGIAPQYQKQVFEMFKRLHSREDYQGTGFGLAICKRIVEYYDGEINLDSLPGEGSVFEIRLPADDS